MRHKYKRHNFGILDEPMKNTFEKTVDKKTVDKKIYNEIDKINKKIFNEIDNEIGKMIDKKIDKKDRQKDCQEEARYPLFISCWKSVCDNNLIEVHFCLGLQRDNPI